MKRIIRNGIFESNSSSTHAICICTDKKLLEEMEHPTHLYFGIGQHGWEFQTLGTPEERANYLYTGILECYGYDGYKEKINKVKDILETYGCEAKFEESRWIKYDDIDYVYLAYGYVDHGDELQEFIEAVLDNPDLLYEYLFSDYSYVQKGNDNDGWGCGNTNEKYNHEEFYKGN